MAITGYIGANKSGKSYEVVSNPILTALRSGRRVVSNIAGLNFDVMRDYLIKNGIAAEQIGQLVHVTHDQVKAPKFFRTDAMTEPGDAFIQPGDLVALDEIWRFWPKRGKLPQDHENFFRMHAHFIHPKTGVACDLVLISQLFKDINPEISGLFYNTFWMVKKTELGKSNMYTVHVYERNVVPRDPSYNSGINTFIRTYDPAIFPMYKSHSLGEEGQSGKEVTTDNRGSMFAGKLFKIGFPLAVILFLVGIWQIWQFFHQAPDVGKVNKNNDNALSNPDIKPGQIPKSSPGVPAAPPAPEYSTAWRVAGIYRIRDEVRVLLIAQDGTTRRLSHLDGKLQHNGTDIQFNVRGERYASWTNTAQQQGFFPGK